MIACARSGPPTCWRTRRALAPTCRRCSGIELIGPNPDGAIVSSASSPTASRSDFADVTPRQTTSDQIRPRRGTHMLDDSPYRGDHDPGRRMSGHVLRHVGRRMDAPRTESGRRRTGFTEHADSACDDRPDRTELEVPSSRRTLPSFAALGVALRPRTGGAACTSGTASPIFTQRSSRHRVRRPMLVLTAIAAGVARLGAPQTIEQHTCTATRPLVQRSRGAGGRAAYDVAIARVRAWARATGNLPGPCIQLAVPRTARRCAGELGRQASRPVSDPCGEEGLVGLVTTFTA